MLNKRKIKYLDLLELVLILISIMLVCGIFNFISNHLKINTFLNNAILLLFIVLTIFVVAIAIFQFVRMKYVAAVKTELKEDMDIYKTRIDNKLLGASTRIGYFEVEYSKKLKKIMKDYLVKTKEIEYIKKELAEKMIVLDKKNAELEVETCLIKIERLDIEHKIIYYKRIVELNDIYPGICDEQILNGIVITYNL